MANKNGLFCPAFVSQQRLKKYRNDFVSIFRRYKSSLEEIKLFLNRIVRDNLVIINGQFGLGEGFFFQAAKKSENERRFRWTQILYIRFQGIDPHGILSLLTPVGRVLFHPVSMILGYIGHDCDARVSSSVNLIKSFRDGRRRLSFFTPHNLMLMAVVCRLGENLSRIGARTRMPAPGW